MSNDLLYTSASFPGIEALLCSNEFHFTDHIHDGYVLWINSGGGECYRLRGSAEILQPGSVSVIEPGVVHSNHPCEGSVRHLRSLYLDQEFFRTLENMFIGTVKSGYCLQTREFEDRLSWNLLLHLHEAIVTKQDRMVIDHCVVLLFSRLLSESPTLDQDVESVAHPSKRLQVIIDYMHERCQEQIALEELAVIGGCTIYHIIRLFKKHIGMSPYAYLVQLRLEKCRQLLENGSCIADAAYQVGFSDQSHLTRKFKLRYGITPGRYIAQRL